MDNLRAYPIYLGIRGSFAFFFTLWATVAAVYRIEVVHLDPLRLVLLGTALEVAVFLFEVPTGVFADTYGRRRSVITGCILMGCGFALEGAIPEFIAVLVAQAVWGVGYTFISGALEAWIADEDPDRDLGRVYLRGEQADYVGSFVGIPASVLLGLVALNLPLIVGGVLTIALGLALVLTMPERNFRPSPREGRSSLQHAATTARSGVRLVRSRPVLLMLLAAALFAGMSAEGFDRLNPKQFLDVVGLPSVGGLEPVVWFGVIGAGGLVLSYLAASIVARSLDVSSPAVAARLLLALDALTMAGMLAFALAGSFAFALGTFWFATLVRRVAEPVYLTWINEGLDPSVRATVISMSSQSGAMGEASAGPVIGAIGNLYGVRPALTITAIVLSPTLLLYVRAMRRGVVEPDPKDARRVE
ncbi:MAG: MFS transporter [Actinomycetota bacterium]|nr:MFS transporter [Actinomycetota bacterium]HYZ06359.1 MFS transporter [Rubrobacter sp.]